MREIACWFIDTNDNDEGFIVRQACFLPANDPHSSLKSTLKAEINADGGAILCTDTSRPFDSPKSGKNAESAINHLGDEVMTVFKDGTNRGGRFAPGRFAPNKHAGCYARRGWRALECPKMSRNVPLEKIVNVPWLEQSSRAMEFRIADTFIASLARFTGDE